MGRGRGRGVWGWICGGQLHCGNTGGDDVRGLMLEGRGVSAWEGSFSECVWYICDGEQYLGWTCESRHLYETGTQVS